jgi:hypothetical protein
MLYASFRSILNRASQIFPHIYLQTKNPSNRRNDRQVKFPLIPGANKDLKPSLTHPPGHGNKWV